MKLLKLLTLWPPFERANYAPPSVTPSHYHELIGPATVYCILTGPQVLAYEVAGPPTRNYVLEGCST